MYMCVLCEWVACCGLSCPGFGVWTSIMRVLRLLCLIDFHYGQFNMILWYFLVLADALPFKFLQQFRLSGNWHWVAKQYIQ